MNIKIFSIFLILIFLLTITSCKTTDVKVVEETIPVTESTEIISTAIETTAATDKTKDMQVEAPDETLKVIGQIGGQTRAVASAGNIVLAGVGSRMTVIDVSDPGKLKELGSTKYLGGEIRDILIAGNVAYLAAGEAGLFAIDITDMMNPVVICQYNSMGYAEGLAKKDRYVFLADGPDGLIIIDANDPSELKETGSVFSYNYAFGVAVKDNFAYIAAAGAGVLIADISDPEKPSEKSTVYTPGYAYGIAVAGDTAYVADSWEGLQAIDIEDPSNPSAGVIYDTFGWAMDVTLDGERLYVAAANGGMRIFDISSGKPEDIGYFALRDSHFQTVAVNGNTVYAADISLGMHIIDVSDPSKLRRIGLYSPMGYAQAVEVSNGYAYIAAQNYGVRVIDIADPSMPREAGIFKYGNPFTTIAISGDTAYAGISFGVEKSSSELYCIDITDPLNLKSEDSIELTGPVTGDILEDNETVPEELRNMVSRNLLVQGSLLFNCGEQGFLIMDISQPVHPVPEGVFLSSSNPGRQLVVCASVCGKYAYLAVEDGGLYILDISNPKNLILAGAFIEPIDEKGKGMYVTDVVVSGDYVYMVDNGWLRVIDVSQPDKPRGVSAISLPTYPFGRSGHSAKTLAVDKNTLFVADGSSGLVVVDITEPADIKIKQQVSLTGQASWVSVYGNNIYVAAEDGGLYIIGNGKEADSENTAVKAVEVPLLPGSECTSQFQPMPLNSRRIAEEKQSTNKKGKTHVVNTTKDDEAGSLNSILCEVQSGDTIKFDTIVFPADNPATIYVKNQLALTEDNITLDASNAGVILDGSKAQGNLVCIGVQSNNCVIKGLIIQNFPGWGIGITGTGNIIGGDPLKGSAKNGEGNVINNCSITLFSIKGGDSNIIKGNIIGLDTSGTKRAVDSNIWSIALGGGAANNLIIGNTIAGNIIINDWGTSYNEIIGNHIGTNVTGTADVEGEHIICITQPFNRIGGTGKGEGNILRGRTSMSTSDIIFIGNIIGFDSTGTIPLSMCISISISSGCRHSFVGGATKAERNIINCSNDSGFYISSGTRNNFIMGNYIGVDISGKTVSGKEGIYITGSNSNVIQQNIIAGCKDTGVFLENSFFNLIRGNKLQNNVTAINLKDEKCTENLIFDNAFIENKTDTLDKGVNNFWDNGSIGNFWDRYNGTDANQDGIGDSPYISENITDRFPLMQRPNHLE